MISSLLILLALQTPPGGTPVISGDAYLTRPVGGLEMTNASTEIAAVQGQKFAKALKVTVRKAAQESNATQLTIPIAARVDKGDVILGTFWLRGTASNGRDAGHIEFLFERMLSPWTKSVTQGATAGKGWRRFLVPLSSAESYQPGEAMVSLRFAFQPQTVEIGGLQVLNYKKTKTLDQLVEYAIGQNPLGNATVALNLKDTHQTMKGLGGNFCQPRYGHSEPMDVVGGYNLKHLNVVHARVGFPLNNWNPEPGVYKDEGPAHAALLQLQIFAKRKIPVVLSVWEGPGWMLGGRPEQMGRALDPAKYKACIDAITSFLVTARDKYGATVDNFSFNEADYGVNFLFTSKTIAEFIRQAGPEFAAKGLKTKFLVGDCGNGSNTYRYSLPLLQDPTIRAYLGPISLHSWDALGATDASYKAIAELGRRFKKEVWCLEAGHDAALWQAPNPWASWENGLRTALAYERTIRLTGATLMDYWTYQDNYPLVDRSAKPYPVFHVMKQLQDVFAPGSKVVLARSDRDDLRAIATVGPKNRFSVLLVNPAGPGKARLAGLPKGSRVQVLTSDKTIQLRRTTQTADASGRLTVSMPLRSVVTVLSK